IEITQKRRGYVNPQWQDKVDGGEITPPPHDFLLRGGCTVLIDLDHGAVRYCIGKGITSEARLAAQRAFARSNGSLQATYFGDPRRREQGERLALPPRMPEIEEETLVCPRAPARSRARVPDDVPRLRRQGPHVPPGARRLLPARLRHRRRAPVLHAYRLR